MSLYQRRYTDMPRPVVNLGRGRCMLWLRSEMEQWASGLAAQRPDETQATRDPSLIGFRARSEWSSFEKVVLLDQRSLSTWRSSTPDPVTVADGRRRIGSTPAGGDAGSTERPANCRNRRLSTGRMRISTRTRPEPVKFPQVSARSAGARSPIRAEGASGRQARPRVGCVGDALIITDRADARFVAKVLTRAFPLTSRNVIARHSPGTRDTIVFSKATVSPGFSTRKQNKPRAPPRRIVRIRPERHRMDGGPASDLDRA